VRSESASDPAFRRLFSPIRIGDVEVPNRIVSTVHRTSLEDSRDLRYIQTRAAGGLGMMGLSASNGILGYGVGPGPHRSTLEWDVKPPSPLSDAGIAYYDDITIPYLQRRAELIHAEGARCYGQVNHSGAAEHAAFLRPMLGPSSEADPYEAAFPHPLTRDEIDELVVAFGHGIRRARDAGLDAAEIHAAHGYLLTQFLSPTFNRRQDEWGGSLENRTRILRAIVDAGRSHVGPAFPIGIRIGVDADGKKRGISVAELVDIARLMAPLVAFVSVSGGNYAGFGTGAETAYVSPWSTMPGYNAAAGQAVREVVDVPVIVTGRIADASIAEGLLADGAADMIGMVRALVADPELPRKARTGRAGEIRMCIGMSECHFIGRSRVPMTCAVNASAGREAEMEIVAAPTPKTVAVVGAGPAGLEAARVAALRGHHVYLCDRSRQLGGTVRVLAMDPNRRNLLDHSAFFDGQLRELGVEYLLGQEISAPELIEFAPDAVIVATGASPRVPDVPGITSAHVVQGLDVLRGEAEVGPSALVVGGIDSHVGAPTLAELLADQGKRVRMISEQFDFASGAEGATRVALLERLKRKQVEVSLLVRLTGVDGARASVTDLMSGAQEVLDDVTVVLACGGVPNDQLATELQGRLPEVVVVGDALAPRRIMHATIEGARAALAL
jgi:2,4-dienoyl-CoA reductase-like NADH-dependent reductase (Old Yellow Enzyme family)/thioredoxin reductase